MITTKTWTKSTSIAVEAATRLNSLIEDSHLDPYCREAFVAARSILLENKPELSFSVLHWTKTQKRTLH